MCLKTSSSSSVSGGGGRSGAESRGSGGRGGALSVERQKIHDHFRPKFEYLKKNNSNRSSVVLTYLAVEALQEYVKWHHAHHEHRKGAIKHSIG